MFFRITGHADAEIKRRIVFEVFFQVNSLFQVVDLFHQVGGIGMSIFFRPENMLALFAVAPQCQYVFNSQKMQIDKHMFGFAFGKPATKNVWYHRNSVPVLNWGCNGNGSRPLPHRTFYNRSVGLFFEFHLVAVCGDIDIFWIEIHQTLNGAVNPAGIVTFQRRQQFKRKNGLVCFIDDVDYFHCS